MLRLVGTLPVGINHQIPSPSPSPSPLTVTVPRSGRGRLAASLRRGGVARRRRHLRLLRRLRRVPCQPPAAAGQLQPGAVRTVGVRRRGRGRPDDARRKLGPVVRGRRGRRRARRGKKLLVGRAEDRGLPPDVIQFGLRTHAGLPAAGGRYLPTSPTHSTTKIWLDLPMRSGRGGSRSWPATSRPWETSTGTYRPQHSTTRILL
jgi:hypothetical protein